MGVQDVKCAGQAEQSQSEGAQHKPAEPSSRRLDLADGGAILLDPLFLRASWIQRRLNSALQAALSLSLKRQEAEGLLAAGDRPQSPAPGAGEREAIRIARRTFLEQQTLRSQQTWQLELDKISASVPAPCPSPPQPRTWSNSSGQPPASDGKGVRRPRAAPTGARRRTPVISGRVARPRKYPGPPPARDPRPLPIARCRREQPR